MCVTDFDLEELLFLHLVVLVTRNGRSLKDRNTLDKFVKEKQNFSKINLFTNMSLAQVLA